jgi:gamma-glutamylcyclotransferase (GGCT)/AIG2-like uncharacterized protein YtfP
MMTTEYLFVYGTLKRDTHCEMSRLLSRFGCFEGDATFQGRLFSVGRYPGAVGSDQPQDRVVGELYTLRDPNQLFSRLDRYEECGPAFPEPTEFLRTKRQVNRQNGGTVEAWIYLYNWSTEGLKRIKSGDFQPLDTPEQQGKKAG